MLLCSWWIAGLDTQAHADAAARAVVATYESHGKPIVTLQEAVDAHSFFPSGEDTPIKIGNPDGRELFRCS